MSHDGILHPKRLCKVVATVYGTMTQRKFLPMRGLVIIVSALALSFSSFAQTTSKPRPFDGVLDNPTQAKVIFSTNSNETQYLGFNWVNAYCFGAVLGCAVQNQPATSSWVTRIAIFSVDDWDIAAECRDQAPDPTYGWRFQVHACNAVFADAVISLRKNGRSLTVRSEQNRILEPTDMKPGASMFSIESAYNAKTEQVSGDGTIEEWKLLFTGLRMQQDLKTFQPQMAVKLIDQVKDLRQYNLLTSDRLEKLLEQDEQENAAFVHGHQPK